MLDEANDILIISLRKHLPEAFLAQRQRLFAQVFSPLEQEVEREENQVLGLALRQGGLKCREP
jgi:hypothetical protein